MNTVLYYVEFEGTPFEGKGPVKQDDHKGWFQMDVVSGGDIFRDVDAAKVGVANQTESNPIHVSDIMMSAEKCSAASDLFQLHIKAAPIKKLTIHRVYSDNNKLVVDEEMIVTNAKIKFISNQNNCSQITFSGFDTFERCFYIKEADGKITPKRVGINLATGAGKED